MKLLENLKQEVCFWRCLYKRQISTQMCADLIEKRQFFKLRQVFRVRWLPDDLWRKLLDCGNAKTVKRYLLYYDYASQVRDVLKLSEEKLKKLKLEKWIDEKVKGLGLEKKDFIFLVEHTSIKLQTSMLFLRKSVMQLNLSLEASFYPPQIHCPTDVWLDMLGNFRMLIWEKNVFLLGVNEVILLLNKMVLDEDEAQELISCGLTGLIEAWLGASLLREKVIQRLDKQGFAFDARPYLSESNKQLLLRKGWNLKDYHLE